MEDRITPGLYLEMTDRPVADYVRDRVPEVLENAGTQRATWWRNVKRDRTDLPAVLPEFDHLAVYEVDDSFRRAGAARRGHGSPLPPLPAPGPGHRDRAADPRTLAGVDLAERHEHARQELRDWADFVHIRHIAEAAVPGYCMITPYENVSGGDPRFMHFYEMDTDDPEPAFKSMTPLVAKRIGDEHTEAFRLWARGPSLRIMYVNSFRGSARATTSERHEQLLLRRRGPPARVPVVRTRPGRRRHDRAHPDRGDVRAERGEQAAVGVRGRARRGDACRARRSLPAGMGVARPRVLGDPAHAADARRGRPGRDRRRRRRAGEHRRVRRRGTRARGDDPLVDLPRGAEPAPRRDRARPRQRAHHDHHRVPGRDAGDPRPSGARPAGRARPARPSRRSRSARRAAPRSPSTPTGSATTRSGELAAAVTSWRRVSDAPPAPGRARAARPAR